MASNMDSCMNNFCLLKKTFQWFGLNDDVNVNYGKEIVAAIGKENLLGVQFHPEKSQKKGKNLLMIF